MWRSWLARTTFVVCLTGCGAGWRAVPPPDMGPLPARQQVQVWQGRQAHQLHGVDFTSDSVSGIPFVRRLDCDSCRIVLPKASIGSIRLGSPEAGFLKGTALVMAIWLLIGVTYLEGYST